MVHTTVLGPDIIRFLEFFGYAWLNDNHQILLCPLTDIPRNHPCIHLATNFWWVIRHKHQFSSYCFTGFGFACPHLSCCLPECNIQQPLRWQPICASFSDILSCSVDHLLILLGHTLPNPGHRSTVSSYQDHLHHHSSHKLVSLLSCSKL